LPNENPLEEIASTQEPHLQTKQNKTYPPLECGKYQSQRNVKWPRTGKTSECWGKVGQKGQVFCTKSETT